MNSETLCVVDEKGYMTEEAGEFAGVFYEKANDLIIERLREVKSPPFGCGYAQLSPRLADQTTVIFRATSQWFASIEALKEEMMDAIKTVYWIPSWGEQRMENMIKDRKEWCISRQRVWGVPLPVFYAEDGTEILDRELINHVAEIFENTAPQSGGTGK